MPQHLSPPPPQPSNRSLARGSFFSAWVPSAWLPGAWLPGLALLLLLPACGFQKDANSSGSSASGQTGKEGSNPEGDAKDSGQQKEARRVHVTRLDPRSVQERLPATSHIEAWHDLEVLSRVSGLLDGVRVTEGQEVKKDQLLFQLDARQAKLELDSAEAKLDEILQRKTEAKISRDESMQRLEQAKKDLKKASNDLARSKESAKEELVSAKQLEEDQLAFDRAKNDLDLSNFALRKALLGLEQIETELKTAKIQRDIQKKKLEDYSIDAPFDGVISELLCKGGEQIGPSTKLCKLTSQKRLVIYFARPQHELARIELGQEVELEVDAFPERVFHAQIAYIAPTVDRNTGTFRARADILNSEGRLRAGMFTRAEIITKKSQAALMLPRTAILYEGELPYAFVHRDGKARRLPIEPGIQTKQAIEAKNQGPGEMDFHIGDEVVVVGNDQLEEGDAILVRGRRDMSGRLLEDLDTGAPKGSKAAESSSQGGTAEGAASANGDNKKQNG